MSVIQEPTEISDDTPTQLVPKLQGVGLPLLALGLVFLPVLVGYIVTWMGVYITGVVLLITMVGPIAGLIIGAICLSRAKNRIGVVGVILAAIAVAIPVIIIVFVLFFFIGAYTGLISLM
ncbi:MAG: hypothetical protein LBG99_07180 [Propionibacteriaceae bacterium]|jgi:hypothetical protein|nr:hypothetical protein [Propionibacteriaceae bacterium]